MKGYLHSIILIFTMSFVHFAYLSKNIPAITLPDGSAIPIEGKLYRANDICKINPGKHTYQWEVAVVDKDRGN